MFIVSKYFLERQSAPEWKKADSCESYYEEQFLRAGRDALISAKDAEIKANRTLRDLIGSSAPAERVPFGAQGNRLYFSFFLSLIFYILLQKYI